jgi:hypothetical protein
VTSVNKVVIAKGGIETEVDDVGGVAAAQGSTSKDDTLLFVLRDAVTVEGDAAVGAALKHSLICFSFLAGGSLITARVVTQ